MRQDRSPSGRSGGAHLCVKSGARWLARRATGGWNGADARQGGGAAERVCHREKAQGFDLRAGAGHRVTTIG